MSQIEELDRVITQTKSYVADLRENLPPEHLASDVMGAYLRGILEALGIIGKILAEKK